jgi:hypothetical protein
MKYKVSLFDLASWGTVLKRVAGVDDCGNPMIRREYGF